MEVRLARVEEVEEIVRLERGVGTAPHWGEKVYREMVVGGGVRRGLFVARMDDVVGFAVGRVLGDEGEVESIAVRETEQGRGVGRALLGAVMAWCRSEGARVIELEVRAGGAAARRLYETAGFTVAGTRPGYYDDPVEDAVLMRWLGEGGGEEGHV